MNQAITVKGHRLAMMLRLVAEKFDGKFDKSGKPYILHLLKVMDNLHTDDEDLQVAALGHDLIEDIFPDNHEEGYQLLRDMGFTQKSIRIIRNMTKLKGESNESYLERLETDIGSVRVKLADLQHNSDIRRLKGLEEKDFKRMQKYHMMYLRLKDSLKNMEEMAAFGKVFGQ